MILVVPMAGRGLRFKNAGIATPKPFIEIRGQWMLEWALKSFDLGKFRAIVFLILKEHEEEFGASDKLKTKYGAKCECVLIDRVTEGAACTALLAKNYVNSDEDLIIKDSDGYIVSNIHDTIEKNRESGISGILSTANIPGDRWSFARLGDDGYVVEVAEKKRISDHIIAGLYYFRHGRDFVAYAEKMIAENKRTANGEFYIAPVYQEMIDDGKKIIIDEVEKLWEFGTPETLQYFLENLKE